MIDYIVINFSLYVGKLNIIGKYIAKIPKKFDKRKLILTNNNYVQGLSLKINEKHKINGKTVRVFFGKISTTTSTNEGLIFIGHKQPKIYDDDFMDNKIINEYGDDDFDITNINDNNSNDLSHEHDYINQFVNNLGNMLVFI